MVVHGSAKDKKEPVGLGNYCLVRFKYMLRV